MGRRLRIVLLSGTVTRPGRLNRRFYGIVPEDVAPAAASASWETEISGGLRVSSGQGCPLLLCYFELRISISILVVCGG